MHILIKGFHMFEAPQKLSAEECQMRPVSRQKSLHWVPTGRLRWSASVIPDEQTCIIGYYVSFYSSIMFYPCIHDITWSDMWTFRRILSSFVWMAAWTLDVWTSFGVGKSCRMRSRGRPPSGAVDVPTHEDANTTRLWWSKFCDIAKWGKRAFS